MLKDIDERLAELYDQFHKFPELSGRTLAGRHARVRVRRSSRREAWVLVGRCLMRRFDRRTWRCGSPLFNAEDTIWAPSCAEIAAETGASLSRVKRALAEWRDAGYFTFHRVVMEYPDGNRFCGLPSVRVATPLLMRRLRISPRKQISNRRQARQVFDQKRGPAVSPVGQRKVRKELRAIRTQARGYQAPEPLAPPRRLEADAELRLERLRLCEEHPDWGLERADAEARRLLGRP